MKRFGKKYVKTLDIHQRTNIVGVFGNTEKKAER
jgi:hypothetical protein